MSYQQFGHVDPEERLDYAEAPLPEEEYEPRSRLPVIMLVAGVAALFVGGLWFAYHEGTRHAVVAAPSGAPGQAAENVPLIKADTDPVKVKPDKVGGMNIPDKDDPLYTMGRGGNAEHILPPPEAPQPRPVAPPPPPPPPQAMTQAPALPPQAAFPAPLPAPAPGTAPAKPAPKSAEAVKPVAAKPAEPAAGGPPTKIQLASLRTPDEARDEWARLKRANDDLLGKFTAVAVRADLGERGVYYRVEAGPVGDRAAAIRLCKALKERGLGCSLVQ
jgi:SPOR domain